MQVETARFGLIDVADDRILSFPDGLPGFPDAHQFALIDVADNDVVYWLQCLDDPGLAFMAAVPWPFFPDYEPEIDDDSQAALGLTDAADAMVLCLLTVHREQQQVTANLLGPVVVNHHTRIGAQIVLDDSELTTDAPLAAAAA